LAAVALPRAKAAQAGGCAPCSWVPCGISPKCGAHPTPRAKGSTWRWMPAPIAGPYAAGELLGGRFYHSYPGGTGLMSGRSLAGVLAPAPRSERLGGATRCPSHEAHAQMSARIIMWTSASRCARQVWRKDSYTRAPNPRCVPRIQCLRVIFTHAQNAVGAQSCAHTHFRVTEIIQFRRSRRE
jgi:hypothetical protein